MLRQNINLYTSFRSSKPKIEYLSWRHLVLASATFLILIIISYVFNVFDLYYQKYHLAEMKKEVAQLQAQIETKKALYPDFFFSENVAKTVNELQNSMRLEASLLAKIANRIPFSGILISLANIDVTNVWVTSIDVQEGGNLVKLTGNALTMPDLKLYFAQIEKNDFFKNDHLTVNAIEHIPKENYPEYRTYLISIAKTQHEKSNS